jgi:hypothetical protein
VNDEAKAKFYKVWASAQDLHSGPVTREAVYDFLCLMQDAKAIVSDYPGDLGCKELRPEIEKYIAHAVALLHTMGK